MGWFAEIKGASSHKGQVVVTRATGASTTFKDLGTAEGACADLQGKLRYFRGAFFENGTSRRADADNAAPPAKSASAPKSPAPKSPPRRRREAGSDDD